jgi:hypothetical protein
MQRKQVNTCGQEESKQNYCLTETHMSENSPLVWTLCIILNAAFFNRINLKKKKLKKWKLRILHQLYKVLPVD